VAALLSTMQPLVPKKRQRPDADQHMKYPAFKRSKPNENRDSLDRVAKTNATPPTLGKDKYHFLPNE